MSAREVRVKLVEAPGLYTCTVCRKVSPAGRMLNMDGWAVHGGCIGRWLRGSYDGAIGGPGAPSPRLPGRKFPERVAP